MQPRITSLDQATSIKPFGIDMKVMLGGEHTGGTFSAVVAEVKPGEGPPPHIHHDREEYFYVLDGTYKLFIDGTETTIGPNTLVFVPRGTVHAFSNIASTPKNPQSVAINSSCTSDSRICVVNTANRMLI